MMKTEPPSKRHTNPDRNTDSYKKYTVITIYVMLVILFAAVCVYMLINPDRLEALLNIIHSICSPILIGAAIAYLLYPIFRFFEKKVFIGKYSRRILHARKALFKAKLHYDFVRIENEADQSCRENAEAALKAAQKNLREASEAYLTNLTEQAQLREIRFAARLKKPSYLRKAPPAPRKIGKTCSLAATYLLFLLLLFLFIWMIVPPCVESIGELILLCRNFITLLPEKISAHKWSGQLGELLNRIEQTEEIRTWGISLSTTLLAYFASLLSRLPGLLTGIVSNVTALIPALFFSFYFLSSKDLLFRQIRKFSAALLPDRAYAVGRRIIWEADRKFGKFIQGKLIDSAILGVVSFILYGALGIPYFQMITLITTVTNLIPFFGPIIGAVPSGVIILISAPDKLLIFIILVVIIQQIEGNILEPWILGDSLGLEPVWIMVAIVVMGELFGIAGMILGVPLFAVIYTMISEFCTKHLK